MDKNISFKRQYLTEILMKGMNNLKIAGPPVKADAKVEMSLTLAKSSKSPDVSEQ